MAGEILGGMDLTRDEYDEDSCCDEHPGPWLGIGFAVLAAFAVWVAWLFLAGCVYKPTINVLPIQPGRTGVRPTPGTVNGPASAPATQPAYRPQCSPDELYTGSYP